MIAQPCLGFDGSCPAMATLHGRCDACRRRQQAARNRRPSRAIYNAAWASESKAIRTEEPWCHAADAGLSGHCSGGLTVDHPTRLPLCRSHHGQLEAKRRAAFTARREPEGVLRFRREPA